MVKVQIDGAPVTSRKEQTKNSVQPKPISNSCNDNPVRIRIDIRISNGLHLLQKEFKLSGFSSDGREAGGFILSVTGQNHFYYVRDFTDMRCKHSRVLSVIREWLYRESCDRDVFIAMSKNRKFVQSPRRV